MLVAERWVTVWEGWIEEHPARLVAGSTSVVGATLAIVDGMSVTTIANIGVLGFTLSMVTMIVRTLLLLLRNERAANRQMRDQLQQHAERLQQDNDGLRARVLQLERRLLDGTNDTS